MRITLWKKDSSNYTAQFANAMLEDNLPSDGGDLMGKKNDIRSIRFSDELAELIDRQQGDTFTQKFENLVTRCVWELPEKSQRSNGR